MQVDWAEMPTRPRIAGRERRVYALVCSLPFSGASTAHFSFDMTVESFLEGHVRAFEWLGGVPRECVYDNLRAAVARRDGDVVSWNPCFLQLRGHYAFHSTACTPETPRVLERLEQAAARAREEQWPYEQFLEVLLEAEVFARDASGARQRVRTPPSRPTRRSRTSTSPPSPAPRSR